VQNCSHSPYYVSLRVVPFGHVPSNHRSPGVYSRCYGFDIIRTLTKGNKSTVPLGWVHTSLPRIVSPYRDSVDSVTAGAGLDVQRHVARPHLLRNRIMPFMRRPNTDSTPNKPITLPRNQLLIRYAVTSPVHTATIRCYDTK
jgi:hypothetical protein